MKPMGMTMAEKILSKNSGLISVRPGQYVTAKIDKIMVGDGMPELYEAFKEIGIDRVWDPSRVIALTDHRIPARDVEQAEKDVKKRKFVHPPTRFYVVSVHEPFSTRSIGTPQHSKRKVEAGQALHL